jgi:RimJ/RimL family protein N-acetyltransferase
VSDRSWKPARRPPETLAAGALTLRRFRLGDLDAMAGEIARSRAHLEPWQDWARTADHASLRAYLLFSEAAWQGRTDFAFGIRAPGGELAGGAGLHARLGPAVLEIGYWIGEAYINRGYATAAARALTAAALALGDVERLEIHCDEANLRSAAVPRKLGYRLDRVEAGEPEATAESGRSMIWVFERGDRGDFA